MYAQFIGCNLFKLRKALMKLFRRGSFKWSNFMSTPLRFIYATENRFRKKKEEKKTAKNNNPDRKLTIKLFKNGYIKSHI